MLPLTSMPVPTDITNRLTSLPFFECTGVRPIPLEEAQTIVEDEDIALVKRVSRERYFLHTDSFSLSLDVQ